MRILIPREKYINLILSAQEDGDGFVSVDLDFYDKVTASVIEINNVKHKEGDIFLDEGKIFSIINGKRTYIRFTISQRELMKEILTGNREIKDIKAKLFGVDAFPSRLYNTISRANKVLLNSNSNKFICVQNGRVSIE